MAGGGAGGGPEAVFHARRARGPGLRRVGPCVACGTATGWCRCDAPARRRRAAGAAGAAGGPAAAVTAAGAPAGDASGTLHKYSWEDGRADAPAARVSVFVEVPAPAAGSPALSREAVAAEFSADSFSLRAGAWRLRVGPLYAEVVPGGCSWALKDAGRRVVLRLQKADPRVKWAGLARVSSVLARSRNPGARDFILQRTLGVAPPPDDDGAGGDIIRAPAARPIYQGPPKYTWDASDRFRDLDDRLVQAQRQTARLARGGGG